MTDVDQLFDVFFTYVEQSIRMDPKDKDLCKKYMTLTYLDKDSFISRAGSVPRYHNFVVSGYLRKYCYDHLGEELTTDLNDGPRFFTSFDSYMKKTVSNEYVQCLTDCVLLRMRRDHLDILARDGITFNDYFIIILQQLLMEGKQRMVDKQVLSAEERYIKMMNDQPNIVQNVPLKYTASYLGIKPGSLSRIRKELTKVSI